MNIVLLDGHVSTHRSLKDLLPHTRIERATHASIALEKVHEMVPDCIVMEIAIPGHSGLEFLYELRSYRDWMTIPVIIYSRIRIPEDVSKSRAWRHLNVATILYKPESSLATLISSIEKCTISV